LAESPAAISNDGLLSMDNNQCTTNMDALNFDDLKFESIFENNTDDLKSSLVQMVKTQTETLEVSFRHFRKEIVVGKIRKHFVTEERQFSVRLFHQDLFPKVKGLTCLF
jgi:hypothetical protein